MSCPPDDTAQRSVVLVRSFDCAPRHLFLAYSTPRHLRRFFGPPGYPLTTCDVDFRVGGRFRFAMTGPDGTENPPFGGTYEHIEPFRVIRFTNGFLVDGNDPPSDQQMVVTLTFERVDDQTRLTMTTVFGSQAMHDEHVGMGFREGTNAGLDQLATLLPTLRDEEGRDPA